MPQALDFDIAIMIVGDKAEADAIEKMRDKTSEGSSDETAVDAEKIGTGMMRF